MKKSPESKESKESGIENKRIEQQQTEDQEEQLDPNAFPKERENQQEKGPKAETKEPEQKIDEIEEKTEDKIYKIQEKNEQKKEEKTEQPTPKKQQKAQNQERKKSKPKLRGKLKKYKEEDNSLKTFLAILGFIVVLFLLILGMKYFFGKKAMTIEELHEQNLKGKFSEKNFFYNGYSFVYFDNLWWTQVQSNDKTLYDIPFRYSPREVEYIVIEPGLGSKLLKGKNLIFISINLTENLSNSQMAIAGVELSRITGKRYNMFNIDTIGAFTTPIEKGVPVITCANATNTTAVVIYRLGPMDRAYSKGDCIFFEGINETGIIKVTDKFIYEVLGIFK